MNGVANLFLVNTRAAAPLNADASKDGGTDPTSKVTGFVTQQSFLSFSVATGLTKFLWRGFEAVFGAWADSVWLPLGIALLFGVAQLLLALQNQDSKLKGLKPVALATITAFLNTLVLWFATIGVAFAADDLGIS